MNSNALCWINNKIIPANEATVSVYDHGLLYGDGIFEGLRFYHGKVFKLDEHLIRLQQSATAISLKLPLELSEISAAIASLIKQFGQQSGYLRLVVTRGKGSLGIDPLKCSHPSFFIIADDLTVVNTDSRQGIKLHIASTRRNPADSLDPKIKSLNYLNNILARIEANEAGMDEAVLLNAQGFITEGTVDNLFIIKEGKLLTPMVSDGLLRGITRDVILEVANILGIECIETHLTVYDLINADECFLTGTGAEIIPVNQINQHSLPTKKAPIFKEISSAFTMYINQHCQQ